MSCLYAALESRRSRITPLHAGSFAVARALGLAGTVRGHKTAHCDQQYDNQDARDLEYAHLMMYQQPLVPQELIKKHTLSCVSSAAYARRPPFRGEGS